MTGPVGNASSPGRFTNIVEFARIDSTNRYALDAARAGAAEGLVVVASRQDSGRGRRGRTWSAPAGGALLCSVLFRPRLSVTELHLVQSALALSCVAAIAERAAVRVGLKWPNDLVADRAKLGGVLTEVVAGRSGSVDALVVGLGLNCAFPASWTLPEPASGLSPTTLEALSGVRVAPMDLLASVLRFLEERYARLAHASGRAAAMEEYREVLTTIGEHVRVETAAGARAGVARAVGDDGRLVVDFDGEVVALDAGDVVHLRADRPGEPGEHR